MKLMLKSILFGMTLTAVLSALTYGLATAVKFLQTSGLRDVYILIFVAAIVSISFSTAYYFGNK